jgi:D-tagatose-1,6-bisphosphate aldolase subunit GatZ/KbaZ
MKHPIQFVIREHKKNPSKGIYSVCSANRFVLQAAMKQAQEDQSLLLVEATSNQVDQFGGYTGMTPIDFRNYVLSIAKENNFHSYSLILGGDHLGPNVWQDQPSDIAMKNALDQIRAYIKAGFTKIHLDASMPLADDESDPDKPLDPLLVARRSAELCKAAEDAYHTLPADETEPVYVIGTDVPVPGGARTSLENIRITPVQEVEEIIALTQKELLKRGLEDAWKRVVAVVVQPGVEFGDDVISPYNPRKARQLSYYIAGNPQLVYEAHSTDYQLPGALKQMVEDHLAILKVGPWLTYAFREAVFSLAAIEEELSVLLKSIAPSNIIQTLDQAMTDDPKYWIKYYPGNEVQRSFARKYSLSDRIRYYWPQQKVEKALEKLMNNLQNHPFPLTLLSQYMPSQYQALRSGQLTSHPLEIIHHKIREVLKIYSTATGMNEK